MVRKEIDGSLEALFCAGFSHVMEPYYNGRGLETGFLIELSDYPKLSASSM
jgi:hypothetical protein